MFTHYEDMKAKKNAKIGVVWRLGSLKVTRNIAIYRAHMTSYLTSIYRYYASILYCFRVIARFSLKVANFYPPHLHVSPP